MIQKINITTILNMFLVCYAFFFPISSNISRLLLYIIIVVWLVEPKLKEKLITLFHNKVFRLYTLYLILLGISLCLSNSIEHGFWPEKYQTGFHYIAKIHLQYFFIAVVLFTSLQKKYISLVIYAFIAAITYSVIISYGIYFNFWNTRMGSANNPTPFMHHIFYSLYLNIGLAIIINGLLNHGLSVLMKWAHFLLGMAIAINIFMIGSRLGYIAFGFLMLYFIFEYKPSFKILFAVIGLLGILFTSSLSERFHQRMNLSVDSIKKFNSEKTHDTWKTSIGIRSAQWIVTLDYLFNHPLYIVFPINMGDARKDIILFAKDNHPEKVWALEHHFHVHNQVLQLVVDGGIVTLGTILSIFFLMWKLPLSQDKFLKNCFLVIFLVYFIGEIPLQRPQPLAIFAIFISLFLLIHQTEREAHPSNTT